MSKINIFALGGLNEVGKNMYVVKVDEEIYIFDAGMKFNVENAYGVDYILPDYNYLKENINKINGIFISHAHKTHMGAVVDILKEIPKIKIYGSNLTIEILKEELQLNDMNYKKYSLNKLVAHKNVEFKNTSIFPISVTHSIPDSFMYVLYTPDGAIVYSGDLVFDMSKKGKYKTDLGKLAYVGKKGVLCLMNESYYAKNSGYTAPRNNSYEYINEVFSKTHNRIITTINIDHIYRLQEIIDAVEQNHKKLIIMGSKLQRRINKLIELKYLEVNVEIGGLNNLNDKNIVVLVSDDNEQAFTNLDRIVKGFDKFLKLNNEDIVFISEPDTVGLERKKAIIMDEIAKQVDDVISMDKNHLLFHSSKEDIRMLINLMNPKFYMPIRGEYKDQVANADIANSEGIPTKNIILKENGDVVEIKDAKLQKTKEKIKVDEILIDGHFSDDVGELVLKDRESLGNNGIVLITVTLDKHTKEVLSDVEIVTRGFIYVKDNKELMDYTKEVTLKAIENNIKEKDSKKQVDYNAVKNEIRETLGKYYYKETEMRPLVISVVQEV